MKRPRCNRISRTSTIHQCQPGTIAKTGPGSGNPPQNHHRARPHQRRPNTALRRPTQGPDPEGTLRLPEGLRRQAGSRSRHTGPAGQDNHRGKTKTGRSGQLKHRGSESFFDPRTTGVRGNRHGTAEQQGPRLNLPGKPTGKPEPGQRTEGAPPHTDGKHSNPGTGVSTGMR